MRLIAAIAPFLFIAAQLHAADPIIIKGGLSPSKQLAVAVYLDKKVDDLTGGEDTHVYLIDARTRKKIGPLEEVDCGGGSWGMTTGNVSALWSPDGKWLAITFRTGRMMHDLQLYQIPGRRAIPVELSGNSGLPRSKALEYITAGPNPGEYFDKWVSNTECVIGEYGLRTKQGAPEDIFEKFGLGDFDDALEKVYQLSKSGKWVLVDIRVPKDQ